MALHRHQPVAADARQHRAPVAQAAHQGRGPPVDEALHQLLVQPVGQAVLQLPAAALPVLGVRQPVGAVGGVGERADPRQPLGQHVDLPVQPVHGAELLGDPVLGQATLAAGQVLEDGPHQAQVLVLGGLAEVRGLAGVPERQQGGAVPRPVGDPVILGQRPQRGLVQAFLGQLQPLPAGGPGEGAHEVREGRIVQRRRPPLGPLDRLIGVGLDSLHQVLVHLRRLPRHPEGAVGAIAPGAAGDLADLLGGQPAGPAPVELAQAGEGHMVHVHVQAHADGVGGHQEVHLPGLVQGHLGVAGAGRQGPHHHRRAPPLAADQLGDGVDILGAERHHGGAAGQAGQLLGAGVGQLGKTLPRDEAGVGQKAPDERGDGQGAQEQGLVFPPGVKQAVGEDMPPLPVGAELDLVHRQELHLPAQRHGLHRADKIGGPRRDDLLLAGDQGHGPGAALPDDAVIDLPRQQTQRQSDHAGRVAQHPLDRIVGLAGVGRSQHRDHAGRGKACSAVGHGPRLGVRRGDSQAPIDSRRGAVKSCKSLWLISGTQTKRIRTESVIQADSSFVPYYIWRL